MKLPLLGKIKHPLPWLLGVAAAGTVLAGTTTYLVITNRSSNYDLEALTVLVQQQDLIAEIQASGTVVPVVNVNISPKSAGRIAKLYIEQGDRVQAGQPLAQMENEEQQAQVRQAEANLDEAIARLAEAEAGTRREQIEQARARLEQAQANLAQARARIPQEIAQAQAQVDAAQARYELSQERLERNRQLLAEGAISQDEFDEVRNEYRSAQASLVEAQRRLQQAQETDRPEINRLAAAVAEAQANLAELEAGVRPEEIAQLQAAVAAARAQLETAQVQLADTVIKAPFTGIVTQKYATEGSFVTPTTSASSTASATSTSILALAQGLEVLANVPEVDVGRLQVGQAAEIVADAYPDRVFKGRVELVAPEAVVEDNVTSFEVQVELLTGQDQLRSGMNVDVTFLGEQIEAALVVPTIAIVTQEGETGVLVANDEGQPEFQPVVLGLTIDDQTQILQGLDPGDRVFIDLPENLREQAFRDFGG